MLTLNQIYNIQLFYSLGLEVAKIVHEIADAEAVARRLRRVGRADALLGRAETSLALVAFDESVNLLMQVEDEVSAIGYVKAVSPVLEALGLVLGDLLEHVGQMDDTAVADDGRARLVDDSTRQQVKVVLDAVGDDRVAGVVAAVEARHHVGLGRQ